MIPNAPPPPLTLAALEREVYAGWTLAQKVRFDKIAGELEFLKRESIDNSERIAFSQVAKESRGIK